MTYLPDTIIGQLTKERQECEDIIAQQMAKLKEINKVLAYARRCEINWTDKIFHAIKYYNEPLTAIEILNFAAPTLGDELCNPIKRKRQMSLLSVTLFRLSQKGDIYSESLQGYKGKLFGLGEWTSNCGNVKPEYNHIFLHKRNKLSNICK